MPVSDATDSSCCGGVSRSGTDAGVRAEGRTGGTPTTPTTQPHTALLALPGGVFRMGSDEQRYPGDGEGPARDVRVGAFRIAPHAVSNDDFAAFAAATGYVTTAEWVGTSFVFGGLLPDDFPPTRAVAAAPWWREVPGASWRRPEGGASDVDGRGDHPVVHVSWLDAREYCRWAGGRLPAEAEWEYAARGGLDGVRYPWGDELTPGGEHRMNVFQGRFPGRDTGEDGFAGTAPVDAYPANGYGLHNTTGNVWEWCADRFGPARPGRRNMRGGSYLCHESYCWRYRCAARSANTPDSSAGNIGFRMAAAVHPAGGIEDDR
ncbi:formylglycine-generating enzyme family protein [Pseudonocardia broussonetiae]|uniref:Formylglycine-generating enzyme family protein n=1 Tax=Pseudonocardia broussonetiae TaxID=2736640 RepID=A0A6M6JL28_9PSEU|nr:formylglycine-generating enzyme family protein [Pseudonocardia broussonetiae]